MPVIDLVQLEKIFGSASRMMNQERRQRVRIHPYTLKPMSWEEYARYRQQYLVKFCPFSSFGPKEEKKCMKQKIKMWLTSMKANKHNEQKEAEGIEPKQELPTKSRKKSSWLDPLRFVGFRGTNHKGCHQPCKSSIVSPI